MTDSNRERAADWPYPGIPDDLHGKLCVVTGASNGIGLETARGLGRMGARVVIICRSREKGEVAQESVTASGRLPAELLLADLRSQRAIRVLAEQYHRRFDPPRIFIHNAGVVTPERSVTEDGIETQFAVNHLAPFLLTQLFLDGMKRVAPARIVVVASQVERGGQLNFSDLMAEREYDPLRVYGQSKLANVMFTYALAERLQGSGVSANCLHPGVVRSTLLNQIGRIEVARDAPQSGAIRAVRATAGLAYRAVRQLVRPKKIEDWALTPDEGARTTLYVATAPDLEGVSGRYFREMQESQTSPRSMDRDAWARLWQVSEELTKPRS